MAYIKLQPEKFTAVTPSDTVDLVHPSGGNSRGAALFVGTAGDISVWDGNNSVLLKNVGNGQFLPINILRVNATGTTAQDIVALW